MTAPPEPSAALRLAAHGFRVDRVTAEVTAGLEAEEIPCLVIKGPAIAAWLYRREGSRLYGDTDLLLRRQDWPRAAVVLRRLGFEDELAPLAHPRMESAAGHSWVRAADEAAVDLHSTLFGIAAPADQVWAAFAAGAVREPVGGVEVTMPGHPARLLHICLHAVQHGGSALAKPMCDLERAVELAPLETWRAAAQLAERLEAAETFAAGLRLTPGGREVAATIGARAGASREAALRLDWRPAAEGFEELAAARGPREMLGLLARELFPNRAFLRWWTPLARRGRRGLLAAYLWRLVWLSYRAVPGFLAWRRALRLTASAAAGGRRPRR